MNDSDILQAMHDDGIIFCMSGVDDGSILWMLTDMIGADWNALQWYSDNVRMAVWDMAVIASMNKLDSNFHNYFKTLQC